MFLITMSINTKKTIRNTFLISAITIGIISIVLTVMPKEIILDDGSTVITYGAGIRERVMYFISILCFGISTHFGISIRKEIDQSSDKDTDKN